jgi:energy-coupling factor transporter ATP-binding protein EcfA2
MEILIENVRSFCDFHRFPIRPLTLLVGENSTGKTTFLAMLAHISKQEFPVLRPSFLEEPFDLGSFDSIATFKGGRYGRADTFSVGFVAGNDDTERRVLATYTSYKGQPTLERFQGNLKGTEIQIEFGKQDGSVDVRLDAQGKKYNFSADVGEALEAGAPLTYFIYTILSTHFQSLQLDASQQFLRNIGFQFMPPSRAGVAPVFAFAPVRTKPRRTYDEISDEFKPEGQHIPVQLARLWQEEGNKERLQLSQALSDFGTKSALFKRIGVKRLGGKPSDPFQIMVTTEGPPVNLLDVGYGVSQALPVLVESVLATHGRRLLLQQPEVHLHPRGQAALGSFFAHLVASEKKEFVIETHSDYIVDRIRTEVAQGNLSASDVLILFFEKHGLESRVHQIEVDSAGNVIGAPESYRGFFLDEEVRVMSRASR